MLEQLERGGAMFFAQLHDALGGGYPGETLDALWTLVWRGAGDERYVSRAARIHAQPDGQAAEAGALERRAGGGVSLAEDDTAKRAGAMDAGASSLSRRKTRQQLRIGVMRWRTSCWRAMAC